MLLSLVTVLLLTRLSVQYNRSPIIQKVIAPRYVLSGSNVRLLCVYNYHTTPYSVRWYRNGKEFYSFVSDKVHPISVHPGPGLTVDMARCDQSMVSLVSVSAETTGRFRCEVSGQAPMFATDTAYTDLSVVTAPLTMGPTITGAESRYHVKDLVSVNCTLAGSDPVANLTWYINNKEAPEKYLKRFPVTDALATSSITLGLQFTAERKYFRNKRRMKLKCVASIFDVYLKVNEISVERIREKRSEYSTERLLNLNYSNEISDVTSDQPSPSYKQNVYPVYLFNAASKQTFTQLLSFVIIFIALTGCQ